MTDFIAFARAHGILIDAIPPLGVWRRYPTEDKIRRRNGAVKFLGTHGFVQNHATSTEVHVWRDHSASPVDVERYRRDIQAAERKRAAQQEAAAKKAQWILSQCQYGFHPYLTAKGFPDDQGNVWKHEDSLLLAIPMRVGHRVVGCQLIDEEGGKKFLFGQRTSGAEYIIGGKGVDILCEGYATGLSIQAAMRALKRPYTIHVTFSAGNMKKVAETMPKGFIVGDHDLSQTGQKTAQEIGWPSYFPPEVGDDFNDFYRKVGQFRASQALNKMLMGKP